MLTEGNSVSFSLLDIFKSINSVLNGTRHRKIVHRSLLTTDTMSTPVFERPSFVDQIVILKSCPPYHTKNRIHPTLAQPLLIGGFWITTGKHWTRRIFCRVEDHSNERMTSSWLGCTGLSSFPWYEHGFSKYHSTSTFLQYVVAIKNLTCWLTSSSKNGCGASCRKIIWVCNTNRDSTLVTAMV